MQHRSTSIILLAVGFVVAALVVAPANAQDKKRKTDTTARSRQAGNTRVQRQPAADAKVRQNERVRVSPGISTRHYTAPRGVTSGTVRYARPGVVTRRPAVRPAPVYRKPRIGGRVVWGHRATVLPTHHRTVVVRGRSYFVDGDRYYVRVADRPDYVLVRPPYGVRISTLPLGVDVVVYGGQPYYIYDDVYYVEHYVNDDDFYYEVVPPPLGGGARSCNCRSGIRS